MNVADWLRELGLEHHPPYDTASDGGRVIVF